VTAALQGVFLTFSLAAVLSAAGPSAMAESLRDDTAPSENKADSGDGGGIESLFEDLDFGFGGDDEGGDEDKGTYLDRFEAPELEVYEKLAAQRSLTLAIQRSSGNGLVASPELDAYVNRVLKRLVAASPVPALDARAYLRAEPEIGAESMADGSIFINIGFLHEVGSEDELGAVMAHELSHVLYRHHGSDWFADSQKIAAQVLSLKDAVEGAADGDESGNASKSTLLVGVGSEMSERIIAPNLWNREQEREADGLGVDLLVAAGYRTGAARTAMERLASYEVALRQHAQQQMDEIAKAAEADMNEAIESGDLSQIMVGLVEGAGTVIGVASEAAIDAVGGGNHDPADVRVERIEAYINREYLLAPRPELTALPWQAPSHPTAPVLAHYAAAREAHSALNEGKLAEAESLIRTAVSAPTEADAYPRKIFSMLRQEQGNFAKAYQNLEIASAGPEPAFVIYRLMIEKQLAGGRPDEAVRLVDEAFQRLGEPPNLYPYQIGILVGAEKKAEALALFAKCKLSYPDLAPACDRALGGLQAAAEGKTEGSATEQLLDREVTDPAKKEASDLAQ